MNTLKTVDKIPMNEYIDRFKSFQRIGLDIAGSYHFGQIFWWEF